MNAWLVRRNPSGMPVRLTVIARALVLLLSLAVAYPVTRGLGADSANWPFLPVAFVVSVTLLEEIERRWRPGPASARVTRTPVLNALVILAVAALAAVATDHGVLDLLRALAAFPLSAIPVALAVIAVARWQRPASRVSPSRSRSRRSVRSRRR